MERLDWTDAMEAMGWMEPMVHLLFPVVFFSQVMVRMAKMVKSAAVAAVAAVVAHMEERNLSFNLIVALEPAEGVAEKEAVLAPELPVELVVAALLVFI
jgi:hypothetical protein